MTHGSVQERDGGDEDLDMERCCMAVPHRKPPHSQVPVSSTGEKSRIQAISEVLHIHKWFSKWMWS